MEFGNNKGFRMLNIYERLIWESLGKAENFMFGYSEEDLMLALDSLNFRNKKGIPGV